MLKWWNKIGKEGEGLSSKKASLRNFVMFGVLKNIFFVIPTPCRSTGQAPVGIQLSQQIMDSGFRRNDIFRRRFFRMPFWLYVFFISLSIFSCTKTEPTLEFMPDMADQLSVKSQEADPTAPHGRMRLPVEGTVSRDFVPYPYKGNPEGSATLGSATLKNSLVPTIEVLRAGQASFETFCSVCHGPKGLGNGTVVPKFPKPPSLLSEKVRGWSDGRIYHVMTEGQNLMPNYASQVPPEDRWAIVHYVRVLQKAGYPSEKDIEAAKQLRK